MSLSRRRTSRVARLTARLKRATKSSSAGVTPATSSVNRQFSHTITPSMPTIVIASMRMASVETDTKS